MVEASEPWNTDNVSASPVTLGRFAAQRSLLVQAQMSPVFVIVVDVFVHEALEMASVQNDNVIEQISAAGTSEAFRHAVLPGASEAGSLGLNAKALSGVDHFLIEVCAAIKDQISRCRIVRKCLAELLNDPCACWMPGHVELQNAPPVVSDDKETIKNAKRERRHCEEIHCGDHLAVIVQKCCPSLCRLRISGRSSHPAQHRTLTDIETKHLELAMNPWRSPSPVLGNHAKDELAQFLVHAFSSRTLAMPGEPGPIELETSSMPANNGLGLNEDQSSLPSRPEAPQHNPEESVGIGKPWARAMSREDQHLLSQRQVFQEKMMACA